MPMDPSDRSFEIVMLDIEIKTSGCIGTEKDLSESLSRSPDRFESYLVFFR